jgi:hypothetical protein
MSYVARLGRMYKKQAHRLLTYLQSMAASPESRVKFPGLGIGSKNH